MSNPGGVRRGTLTGGERGIVVVEEFFAIEGHETLQDAVADTSGADGADDLVLEIKRIACDFRDLPVTTLDHLKSGPPFISALRNHPIEMWDALHEQEQSS